MIHQYISIHQNYPGQNLGSNSIHMRPNTGLAMNENNYVDLSKKESFFNIRPWCDKT